MDAASQIRDLGCPAERFSTLLQRAMATPMKLYAFILLILAATVPVSAQTPLDMDARDHTTLKIFVDTQAVEPGVPFRVGVALDPAPQWHTYWRNPGDSGMRNTLAWTLPAGASASDPRYPVPERLPLPPLMNYGYKRQAVMVVEITPPADLPTDRRFEAQLRADWLVCADVCVPEGGNVSFTLPVSKGQATAANEAFFDAAEQALPLASPWQIAANTTSETLELTVDVGPSGLRSLKEAYFFPYSNMLIDHAATQRVSVDGSRLVLTMPLAKGADPTGPITGILKVDSAAGDVRGYRVAAPLTRTEAAAGAGAREAEPSAEDAGAVASGATPATAAAQHSAGLGLPLALLFALLGGLVLNLMPCVFPVLSLKALSLAHSIDRSAAHRRRNGLAYLAGVEVSMLAVAALLLALKGAGQAVGWGFQLQNPWIVVTLALVLFTVGLTLAGVLEIGGRFAGVGDRLTRQGGLVGAFFTGVLATVVASPCTAPFMAVALGFALTQSPPLALAVFATLGLGLALPILALSLAPKLGRLLPKPGPWMTVFKQAMAFPMFLAVVWLVWVLGLQTGSPGVAAALAAMVLIAFAAWLARVGADAGPVWRGVGAAVALAGLSVWAVKAPDLLATQNTGSQQSDLSRTEPFTRDRLAELRQAGEPVFVYFTAAWCITCQVNERVALDSARVETFLADKDIHVLVGDWTNRDDRIGQVLRQYGRSGVPLYLFFTGSGQPVILPQILSPGGVVTAMQRALDGAAAGTAS